MIVVPAQYPEAAAREIRRVGGRDEFAGIFLPGGARIPYGNPVHDPIWEAANELALPVVVHTHYEGVGIAGPVTAAGYPDFYVEYHTLCGSGMYGHFVSILCHGIFERFPDTKVMMVEGGLVPFVGLLWRLDTNWKACRSEIPWCKRRPSEYVWDHVRFATQPLESPDDPAQLVAAIEFLRPWQTLMYASDYPHWDFDEPAQTSAAAPVRLARQRALAERAPAFSACPPRPRMSSAEREARLPLDEAPAEGSVRMIDVGGHRVGLSPGRRHPVRARRPLPTPGRAALLGRSRPRSRPATEALTLGKPREHRALPLAQVGVRDLDRPGAWSTSASGPHVCRGCSTATRSSSASTGLPSPALAATLAGTSMSTEMPSTALRTSASRLSAATTDSARVGAGSVSPRMTAANRSSWSRYGSAASISKRSSWNLPQPTLRLTVTLMRPSILQATGRTTWPVVPLTLSS